MNTALILFRQDPALRVLPRGIITALCVGLFFRVEPDLAHGLATLSADDLPGGLGQMYLVAMLLVLTFVLSANAWTRASRISVGLPLSTRTAWLVRTASLIAVAGATIFTMAFTLGVNITTEGITLSPVIALAALRATFTTALLILLYQLPLADRDRIPITPEYVIYIIFISLIIVPFSAAGLTSVAGSTFFLATSIGLGVWLFIRTPGTWSVGPSVAEADEPVWSSREPHDDQGTTSTPGWEPWDEPKRPALVVQWTVFRGLNNILPKWLILICIAGAMTVSALEFFDGVNAFLPLVLVTVWHLPVLQMSLERMTPFDSLPISRRVLWAHTFGPAILALLIGVLAAHLVSRVDPSKWTPIHIQTCCVEVPWEYLEIAPDGNPPTITAPWGESITPTPQPLWRGKRPALYDPYEVMAESSPRFVEHQIHRAVAAVYGVPPHLVDAASNGRTSAAESDSVDYGNLILHLTRDTRAEGRSRSAAIALILCTAIMLVLMILALLQYGSSPYRKFFKWALWGTLVCVGVFVVAFAVIRLAGYTETWFVGAVVSIGIRHLAERIPVPTGLLWISVVTFWFGTYLLLESIFKRIELPGRNIVNRFAEEY